MRIEAGSTRDWALRATVLHLGPVSGDEARLDASVLLEEATGLSRADLLGRGDRPLGTEAAARLELLISRRLTGMPTWRVLGRREFWGLSFRVTPAVLDPRPDTETLVVAVLEALGESRAAPLRMLDLGTGSGALLAALLHECPNALGWGVDRSSEACHVASDNLSALGLADRALIVNGDWTRSLASGRFDLVVSNPPYIETDTIGMLDIAVREHDPHLALDGGPDGLACFRVIVPDLSRLLRPGGLAGLEVGVGQAAAVTGLLSAGGFAQARVRRDLGGHERALVATRD